MSTEPQKTNKTKQTRTNKQTPNHKPKQKSKREWSSNTETVFLGYNDATASQITVTYMQDFSISVVFLLLLTHFVIQLQVNIKEAVSPIMNANIVSDERYPQRCKILGKKHYEK